MSTRLKVVLGATLAVALVTAGLFVLVPGKAEVKPLAASASVETPPPPPPEPVVSAVDGKLALAVTGDGFEPARAKVPAGVPVTLEITRKTDDTCAKAIVIPGYGIKRDLPLGQTVAVTFTPKKSGELRYGCAHEQMVSGVLLVE